MPRNEEEARLNPEGNRQDNEPIGPAINVIAGENSMAKKFFYLL